MANQIRIKLPAPHAAQRQVLAEAKRFNVLACGRRFGKTTLGIDRIVKTASGNLRENHHEAVSIFNLAIIVAGCHLVVSEPVMQGITVHSRRCSC